MFKLKHDNVVKLTDSPVKRDQYISEGYVLVEPPGEQPAALPDEGAPAETEPTGDAPEEAPTKGKVKPGDKRNS